MIQTRGQRNEFLAKKDELVGPSIKQKIERLQGNNETDRYCSTEVLSDELTEKMLDDVFTHPTTTDEKLSAIKMIMSCLPVLQMPKRIRIMKVRHLCEMLCLRI